MVVVADGTREADEKLQRVLTCDPGLGVVRHADAGYPEAIETARAQGIDMPSLAQEESSAMIIPERPSLERRVLTALDGSAGSPARIPVVLGGCGTGRTSLLLRLRDLIGPNVVRSTSTSSASRRHPSGFSRRSASTRRRLPRRAAAAPAEAGAREAFDATLALFDTARASGGAPATFLLDEFLELRTFESFPGLRTVLRDLIGALATSGNRFVLTSRYTARALRLLRDAPSHVRDHPRHAADDRGDSVDAAVCRRRRGSTECHPRGRSRARARRARAAGTRALRRPARYARLIADTSATTRPAWRRRRSARCPPCWRRTARSIAACRFSYELRLHRARGYGALKAILSVLAEEEPLTLTEIALRLASHARIDQGLPVLARGRRSDRSRQKRYSFADPLLRLWVRLHGRPVPPTDEDLAREVHSYVMTRLPGTEPALVMAGGPGGAGAREKNWGIIEID